MVGDLWTSAYGELIILASWMGLKWNSRGIWWQKYMPPDYEDILFVELVMLWQGYMIIEEYMEEFEDRSICLLTTKTFSSLSWSCFDKEIWPIEEYVEEFDIFSICCKYLQ